MSFQNSKEARHQSAPWVAIFLLSTATALCQTMLRPECKAANDQAIEMLNQERNAEVAGLLAGLVARLGDSHQDRLCQGITLFNLALAHQRLGAIKEAESAASRSLALLESEGGANSSGLRRTVQFLAVIAVEKGQFGNAEQLIKRAESMPGADTRDRAVGYGLEAILSAAAGHLADAEKWGRLCADEWERAGLGDTLDAEHDLSNLAICLMRQHRPVEALVILQRCLGIIARSPNDPTTRAKTLLIMATAYADRRDRRAAEDYFQQAIGVFAELPPVIRRDLGRTLFTSYASFLRNVGRTRDAKTAEEQARAFGPDPSTVVVDVNSLMPKQRKR